jgi:ABC-type branched-subunit amino acid transport system substrate-binding protein
MVINTQDAAPTDGGATIITDAAANNVKTDHRAVPVTVTDVTEPILAAKGINADAIWNWGYPTTDALTVKTAATNDFKGAIMTFSAGTAAEAGLIPGSLLTDKILSVATNCAPSTLPTPAAKAYTTAYKKKFGTLPGLSAVTENYDALFIWKAAAQRAKSVVGTKVAAAIGKVSYAGVCGTEKADQFNNLLHSITVITFPSGKATLAKQETNVPASS